MKRFWGVVGRLTFSATLTLILLEVGIRFLTPVTMDGQYTFMHARLLPRRLPVREVAESVYDYYSRDSSTIIADPLLGWTFRPLSADFNAAAIRSEVEYEFEPPDDVLRIAVFGDSFTHADEVDMDDSWAYRLETMLNERGVAAEVLNFGVAAYGMDQAYLRWQQEGAAYHPDIVIWGFVAEDLYRNGIVFFPLYTSSAGLPFTKPRFILADGQLELVNSPAIPPEDIPEALESLSDSPLAAYEYYYDPDDYRPRLWTHSRFLAVTHEALMRLMFQAPDGTFRLSVDGSVNKIPHSYFDLQGEPMQITRAILDQWEEEAAQQGQELLIVHLPRQIDFESWRDYSYLAYADLFDEMQSQHRLVDTLPYFDLDAFDAYYAPKGHFSPEGNGVIAEALADYIVTNYGER